VDTTAVWTAERILDLAPDASSAKAGRELATPRKWVTLGQSEVALWGECQGSGANPYKTSIDRSEPAFKCTCPSHKFPCKHGLGLFLLFEAQAASFPKGVPPAWVAEWLQSRAKRAEQAVAKREQTAGGQVADPAAQAKAAAQRQARVSAGIRDLQTWLGDLARTGLSAAQGKPYSFWEDPAKRLVDAQAPGLARMVRSIAGIPSSGEGWPERLLEQMGKLHLLLESYERIDSLPPDTQADVRSMIGWTVSQDELLQAEGISDMWCILSQEIEEEDRLRTQFTWLWGYASGRPALVLDFAYGNQPLDKSLTRGTAIDAEIVYFPASVPLRALVKKKRSTAVTGTLAHSLSTTISAAMETYANALAFNPWLERFPMLLGDVTLKREGEGWWVRDSDGKTLPLAPSFSNGWQILGLVGGWPFIQFGEWNGRYLRALQIIPKSPE
jgi:hypothetical protein